MKSAYGNHQPVELPPCPVCGKSCTKLIGKHIFDTHTKEETSYYCFVCNQPINATKREVEQPVGCREAFEIILKELGVTDLKTAENIKLGFTFGWNGAMAPKRESISLTTKQANDLIMVWKLLQKVATVESSGACKLITEHASMRVDGEIALAYIEPIIAKIQHMSTKIEGQS